MLETLCYSEVAELNCAVATYEDIRGSEIAVRYSRFVGEVERLSNSSEQEEKFVERKGARPEIRKKLREADSIDKLHRNTEAHHGVTHEVVHVDDERMT